MPLIPSTFPWLSSVLFILLLGAIITLCLPNKLARQAALISAVLTLLVNIAVVMVFDNTQAGFQLVENYPWIPNLQVNYQLGVDGLSVLFLPFTSLLFLAVILASWNAVRHLPSLFFALMLFLQLTLQGIFSALDTLLFFLFWELSLLPFFFLISLWGAGANRRYAAVKYTLFMMTGGITILLGLIVLALQSPEPISFAYSDLLVLAHHNPWQTTVFFLLLFGFAIKLPLFPFHAWLPVVAQEGPANVVAVLVGLKVGAYGLLRYVIPLAPEATQQFDWLLIGMGMLGVLYGTLAALSQTNLRRMLAYASLSHISMVVLGIVSFNQQGLQAAIFQLLNFTLIASGLFIILGFIHQRIGSTEQLSLGGMASSMPLLATFFLLFGLGSLGLPGTSGFPAEFLLIMAILQSNLGAGLLVLFSIILTAAYFLTAYRKAFLGEAQHTVIKESPDLKRRELLIVVLLAFWVLFWGFYPQPLLNSSQVSSAAWLEWTKRQFESPVGLQQ